jgi:hypothetical protein
MIVHTFVPIHGHQMLRVFFIPFNFTCSLLFSSFGLQKNHKVCFGSLDLKYQNTRSIEVSYLFIKNKLFYVLHLKNRKEKLQKKIQLN